MEVIGHNERPFLRAFSQVKVAEKQIAITEAENDETSARIKAMNEHLRSIQLELQQAQNILDARKRQVEDEQHLKIMVEKEQVRLKADIARTEKEIRDISEGMTTAQNNVYKAHDKIEVLRREMQMNEGELAAWFEKAQIVQDDAAALEQYTRADEAKIKDLTLQLEKLVAEAAKTKKALDQELTDTHVNHVALEKVGFLLSHAYSYPCIPTTTTGGRQLPPHSRRAHGADPRVGVDPAANPRARQ